MLTRFWWPRYPQEGMVPEAPGSGARNSLGDSLLGSQILFSFLIHYTAVSPWAEIENVFKWE